MPIKAINRANLEYHIVSLKDPSSAIAEQYRKLRTNIDYSNFNKEIRVMSLTSTFPGEGKTVTALNLGTVYSQSESKTLIIDMDLRKPKIHRAFNISNSKGLTNIVIDGEDKDNVIHEITDNLHVLPSGEKMPFPAEFLMSKKLRALIDDLRTDYDKIIIDCPPMTAVTDASIISKFTDGTLVVVASRRTNSDIAKQIVKTLNDNGANIIGSILTRVQKKDHRYLAGYYYYSEYMED